MKTVMLTSSSALSGPRRRALHPGLLLVLHGSATFCLPCVVGRDTAASQDEAKPQPAHRSIAGAYVVRDSWNRSPVTWRT
ncbi:hypothetical protein BDY21DRAFT_120740 [Lineolata rhizophorae]|uniref:Uncharacterized protein n=1 Tax=Lineolata rhizophorae TaxID=578093 RepID=A0A6A6NQH6_9PEZI|nr:hypothetical protein BDY21DRAFT_120740 [Lineolata rhizophorae]